MPFGQVQIPGGQTGQLLIEKDTPATIQNLGPNTVYLYSSKIALPGNLSEQTPFPVNTAISYDGSEEVWGACVPGQSATINYHPAGSNIQQQTTVPNLSILPVTSFTYAGLTNQPYGPFPANLQSLILRFFVDANTTGYGHITLSWFQDAAMTIASGSNAWSVSGPAQYSLLAIVPAEAPYFVITVHVTSAASLKFQQIFVCGLPISVDEIRFPIDGIIMTSTGNALAAGTTVFFYPLFQGAGAGTFFFNPHDTAGQLTPSLELVNEDLTNPRPFFMFNTNAPTGTISSPVSVANPGSGIWRVKVVNADAVNPHTFDYALSIPQGG